MLAFRSFISVDIGVRMSQHMTCKPSDFHCRVFFPSGKEMLLFCD